jgi:hypothetical protein
MLFCFWLAGCGTTSHSGYSEQDKQSYPKASADADTVVALISNKDNTRFNVDGQSIGGEIQAGGELKILVNKQSHDILAQAAGYKSKPQHIQPPYDEHSPISFSFIYKDKLEPDDGTLLASETLPSNPITSPAENLPIASDHEELPIPTDTGKFGNYIGLIIGNEKYQHTEVLKTPIDDAESIKSILVDRYGFSQVKVIRDATRHDILGALAELQTQADNNTNVLIFYAGHGHYDEDENRGYWLPVDAEPDNPANWIANDDVTSKVKAMAAKHVLVIADSCYSGSLTRAVRGFGVSGKLPGSKGDNSRYLHKMANKKTRKVMTSGGNEPVADAGGNGNHSVFASAVVSVLQDSDGVLEGTLLFNRIREKVANNADQTPEYGVIRYAGDDGGDFLFIPRN